MFKTIKPLAFKVKKNLKLELFFIQMPEKWVREFNNLFFDSVSNKRMIKTKQLKELFFEVSPDILYVGDFYNSKIDKTWLITLNPVDRNSIFSVIKAWCSVIQKEIWKPETLESFIEWSSSLQAEDIEVFEKKLFHFTDETGAILDKKLFDVIPKLLLNKIADNGLILNGEKIPFLHGSENKIISEPTKLYYETKNLKDYYSISLDASLQTIPSNREPWIIFEPKVTRWITRKKLPFNILKSSKTTVYVRSGEKSLYPLQITYSKKQRKIIWDPLKKKVFEEYFIGIKLPDAEEYMKSPGEYINNDSVNLYTNYRIDMGSGFTWVKAGIPIRDKFEIYENIFSLLAQYVDDTGAFERAKLGPKKYQKNILNHKPKEFRISLAKAIDSTSLNIEVYYEFDNPFLENVKQVLKETLGIDKLQTSTPELNINITFNKLTKILGPLEGENSIIKHENRIKDIQEQLGMVNEVTACLVLLPYKDAEGELIFNSDEDPKKAIRAGFATTGRLAQFLTPNDDESLDHRIKAAVYDMYRQLGYVEPFDGRKKGVEIDYTIPVIGMHIINYKKTPYGNTDRALVTVTIDQKNGKVFVECPALWKGSILYWKAALAFQQVATEEGKRKFTRTRVLNDIKSKVYELFHQERDQVLIINSSGTSRNIWKLLTDSELSKAEKYRENSLKTIWFNEKNKEDGLDTHKMDSGLRIIRIRSNEEVPMYICPLKDDGSFESKTGLFKYNDVYYGIGDRPLDKVFSRSYLSISKIEKPNFEFKVPNMIEIYPIYIKEKDVADHWVSLINNYRGAAHQYKGVLKQPLPLHLASKLEEYIY